MIWAVLDTNVVVSGLGWSRGAPASVVDSTIAGGFVLVSSEALLDELGRVVRYPKLRRFFPDPTETVALVRETCLIVAPEITVAELTDDADNRVLEAAMTARTEAIVTGDAGMLLLGPIWQGIQIVNASEFLVLVEAQVEHDQG